MDPYVTSTPNSIKLLILDTGKFEQWKFRIQQYLQHEHYALWEVIEFGDSYRTPAQDKTEGSETLEQTFNRLQAIVSQLEFLDVPVKQEDLNQKFLTSLSPEWLMHTIVWRNINDLDTMSWMICIIISRSMNQRSKRKEDQVLKIWPLFLLQIPTVEKIDDDDIEEMDIKWNMDLLSMRADRLWKKTSKKITIQGSDVAGFDKSKVECFNCHKLGNFVRECRAPRSQDRSRRESYKKEPKVEEPSHKAMMAIDGIGWD
ncbi:putative ribonuclease H-like domain-containing protein [Tanacetum coccineum]|uniref:Ribonuclease H-like domain-containing protein n=1 Tax=Tanacetum coccineum TaxID=301880 RepID=A0ABQ5E1B3_9ASTR